MFGPFEDEPQEFAQLVKVSFLDKLLDFCLPRGGYLSHCSSPYPQAFVFFKVRYWLILAILRRH
jgi:hypothetical protein